MIKTRYQYSNKHYHIKFTSKWVIFPHQQSLEKTVYLFHEYYHCLPSFLTLLLFSLSSRVQSLEQVLVLSNTSNSGNFCFKDELDSDYKKLEPHEPEPEHTSLQLEHGKSHVTKYKACLPRGTACGNSQTLHLPTTTTTFLSTHPHLLLGVRPPMESQQSLAYQLRHDQTPPPP